jgi:serine/threonine protein kinase
MPHIGRYQVVRELGRGAMGIVFEARDPLIDRTVAVKTIRLDTLGDASEADGLQERLFREARSAGALSHPGIVVVHDLGRHEDMAYIAMERVDGPTLEHVLATGGLPKREDTLNILRQTATALDYAHSRGVVHRDIKPGNLMLDRAGPKGPIVKITDFGIAKIASTQQLTRTGTVMGTPSYMSPEQITAQPLDGRADQFSLAVIAFEMLAGARPFRADTLAGLVHQIVYEERASARSLRSDLPDAADAVLLRGLSKNAGDRYPSCLAFVEDLERGMAGVAAQKASVPPRRAPSRGWIAAAIATVLVVAGIVTAGVVWHRRALTDTATAAKTVPVDEAQAAYSAKDYARVRLLAEEGNAEAQDDVGFMYESGRGVEKDRAQAVDWYRKSAAQGYQPAKDALKRFGLVP